MDGFDRLSKMAGIGAKKEKKKETQFLSKPYPIRAREEKRQALTFPAIDQIKH
jgi:hypothetical protein